MSFIIRKSCLKKILKLHFLPALSRFHKSEETIIFWGREIKMIFMWYYVGSCAIQNFVKIGNLKGFPNRPFWAKNKRRESYRSYTHIGISKKCIQYCTAFYWINLNFLVPKVEFEF